MNSESIPSISFDWKSIALKWEINKWMLSRVWNFLFVWTGNLVIIMTIDISAIIQKFNNILSASIIGEEFRICLEGFSSILFDIKKGFLNSL